mmetsp:Transcript_85190/g.164052  ORF Transcript_85190/g.164052 Transcript_85190/m.164052 type:complete len:205 (-) Transcript_85190:120-734(-)
MSSPSRSQGKRLRPRNQRTKPVVRLLIRSRRLLSKHPHRATQGHLPLARWILWQKSLIARKARQQRSPQPLTLPARQTLQRTHANLSWASGPDHCATWANQMPHLRASQQNQRCLHQSLLSVKRNARTLMLAAPPAQWRRWWPLLVFAWPLLQQMRISSLPGLQPQMRFLMTRSLPGATCKLLLPLPVMSLLRMHRSIDNPHQR